MRNAHFLAYKCRQFSRRQVTPLALITRKFTHEGKTYETRAALDEGVWHIAIFDGNSQVGGKARVRGDVQSEAAASSVQRLMNEAMSVLEEEFKNGRAFEIDLGIWHSIADGRA